QSQAKLRALSSPRRDDAEAADAVAAGVYEFCEVDNAEAQQAGRKAASAPYPQIAAAYGAARRASGDVSRRQIHPHRAQSGRGVLLDGAAVDRAVRRARLPDSAAGSAGERRLRYRELCARQLRRALSE